MNRTVIHEVGMLTQCYDNRALHQVTETDEDRATLVIGAVQLARPGQTVLAASRDVHMRVQDARGLWTTLGERLGAEYPLVILRCDPREDY